MQTLKQLTEEIALFQASSREALERSHALYPLSERELPKRTQEAGEGS